MKKIYVLITAILLLFFSFTWAQGEFEDEIKAEVGITGVGVKAGLLYLTSEYGLAPGFGLWFDWAKLGQNIIVDGGLEYWVAQRGAKAWDKERKRDFAIFFTLKYAVEMGKFTPFLGGGFGINMYKKTYPENIDKVPEKSTKPELHIDAGTTYFLNPKMNLEARFKVNISDVSSFGLYVSMYLKTGK